MPDAAVLSRAQCAARDAHDPLFGLRAQFHLPEGVIYLDGNSLGPLPRATPARLAQVLNAEWGEGLIRSWNSAGWIDLSARVGAKISTLIGAAPDEVLVADTTSINLFKVLAAALDLQARTRPERTVLVSERHNFPTDLYMAQGLAQLLNGPGETSGYELVLVDDDAGLRQALADGPALVFLTHVDYRTGRIHDMADVTRRVHAAGALMIWDLAHSAGAVPLALSQAGADFAVGCGYKYLNGGPGAPAFVYVARRHQDAAHQPLSGWLGHAAPFAFEPNYRPAPGIMRFQCGTPSIVALSALECGVDSLLAALPLGGMEALREKSVALGELFIALVEDQVGPDVLALASPRAGDARGSQVSFAAGAALGNGYALMQALIDAGVIGDFRAPNILRFGFCPLYVRYVDVWDAAAAIAQLISERTWDQPRFQQQATVT